MRWQSWRGGKAARAQAKPEPSSYFGIFDHLSPQTIARGVERLRHLPLFSTADYEELQRSVLSGRDSFDHAFRFGMFEERQIFEPIRLARFLAALPAGDAGPVSAPAQTPLVTRAGTIAVYVSTRGNLYMREIARHLVRDLCAAGMSADLRDEKSSIADCPAIPIFVAPHEFFILDNGWDWVRDTVLDRAFMVSTEQIQTSWFAKSLPMLLMSRGVIDLCRQTAACFSQIPLPAFHLLPGLEPYATPLGDKDREHPLFGVLPAAARKPPSAETAFDERPLDVAFFGTDSPRRHQFFAQNAAVLAGLSNVIYMRPISRGPVLEEGEEGALTRIARHVCGHARITLNLHRSTFSYFEWHRIVHLGMASGSVVVSDRCLPQGEFLPGVHYFEETPRQIPNLLLWLLRTEEGRAEAERIRCNALALLTDRFRPQQTGQPLRDFLLRHARP